MNPSLFAVAAVALLLVSCASTGSSANFPKSHTWDTLIIPGQRIGPVAPGDYVDDVEKKLGKPDSVRRDSNEEMRKLNPGRDIPDKMWTRYDDLCLAFGWTDQGLRPRVDGVVTVWCDAWSTAEGVHVGSAVKDVVGAYGDPDDLRGCRGDQSICRLDYDSRRIEFNSRSRDDPIQEISVWR